jgi:hypothetical protein
MDLASVEMLPSSDIVGLGLPVVSHPFLLLLGCVLILIVPLYLWLLHPIALKMIKTIWINKRLTITQVDKNL